MDARSPPVDDALTCLLALRRLTLGDLAEAERLFRFSLDLAERRRSPFEQARSKARLADTLAVGGGTQEEVARLRQEARRTAEQFGLRPVLDQLED